MIEKLEKYASKGCQCDACGDHDHEKQHHHHPETTSPIHDNEHHHVINTLEKYASKGCQCDACGDHDHPHEHTTHKTTQHLEHQHEHGERSKLEIYSLIGSIILYAAGFLFHEYFFIAAYVLSGYGVILRAIINLSKGNPFDEFFLMSLATIVAIIIGELPEAAAVMIFFGVGEYFQDKAVDNSRKEIRSLVSMVPEHANVITPRGIEKVTPKQVHVGEQIVIHAGERIPLDGILESDHALINNAAITGESIPLNLQQGSSIYSGGIVLEKNITIEVTKRFDHSTMSRIIKMVEEAGQRKTKTEKFITRFAKVYTPVVVLLATLISLLPPLFGFGPFRQWLYSGMIFLVVSCPCALVISVPLGFFAGIGRASKSGILIKSSEHLENLHKIDHFVFDKTGTLTTGKFEVSDKIPAPSIEIDELISAAVTALSGSTHPVAQAISKLAVPMSIVDKKEIAGMGVVATDDNHTIYAGNTKLMEKYHINIDPQYITSEATTYIAKDGIYLGQIHVVDTMKNDASQMIKQLQAQNKKVTMLTGDKKSVADTVAKELNISNVQSNLMPQEKYQYVLNQADHGEQVCFVGDGINDAPVLAASSLGISIGIGGSDSAIEASDIVLMSDRMESLTEAISISNHTKRIVTQNIIFAIGVKVLIMTLGVFQLADMWMAILADVGVTLLAVLNSLRILYFKRKDALHS